MTISNNSGVTTVSGTETAAGLATFFSNNAGAGTRSGDYYRLAWPLSIGSNSSLTLNDGTAMMLEGTTELRLDASGTVNFGTGSELRFTGTSKNHSQINGTIVAYDFNYVIDTPTAGSAARNDPFSSSTTMQGSRWSLVLRGGIDTFVHLHGSNGVTGLSILNKKTSGGVYIEFAGRTYRNLSFPAKSGTGSQTFQAPRDDAANCLMVSPVFNQTGTLEIKGATGQCWLIDPSYPNISGVPVHSRVTASGVSGVAGDLIEYFTLRADAFANQSDGVRLRVSKNGNVVFNDLFVTASSGCYAHPDGYLAYLMEARKAAAGGTSNARNPFAFVMRRAGMQELTVASFTPAAQYLVTQPLSVDPDFTGTVAQAAAVSGVVFTYAHGSNTVAVAVTGPISAQQIYNHWTWWTAQSAQMGSTLVPMGLIVINAGVLTITGTLSTDSAISGGGNVTSIKTTGAITLNTGGAIALPFEDSAGVRVIITKSGGGNFNIFARHRTGSGSYTNLGYAADVGAVTYTVPRGDDVEVDMWSLGCVTYSRTISTAGGGVSFSAEMTINPAINTTLDVSSYLADIALSLDTSGATPKFVITFNAPVVVAGIELGKAIIHRLAGYQVALAAGLPPGGTSAIAINADEITNNLPSVRLDLGSSLTGTDRVYLDFFINTTPALVVDSTYVINPPRADGNQVQILRAKPALDASILAAQAAAAVRTELAVELGRIDVSTSTRLSAIGYAAPTLAQIEASTVLAKESTLSALATVNQAEHDATQQAIATLPVPLNSTQTQAAAAAALVAYDAAVPGDLANLATTANVTAAKAEIIAEIDAIPTNPLLTTDTRLNNLDAAISTRSTLTAPQVRTELATELGRIDVAVSTRLATSAYTAPTTPPTAVQIRQEIDTNSTKLDVAVGTRLAASSYVAPTAAPSAADNAAAVRTNLATELARIDVATSTRLATAGYTAPANADIAAIKAKTDTLVNGPTLLQIEGSTVLAKEATVSTRATQTSVSAIPTNPLLATDARLNNLDAAISTRSTLTAADIPAGLTAAQVRTELSPELARIDVPTSSRLASADYTAPVNADIAAIKAKTDSLSFTQAGQVDANIQYVNDVQVKGTGIEDDPWNPA